MMQVKLKVLRGASAGTELAIRGRRFLIGRSEKCDLRPHSDAVSREHCEFLVSDDELSIRDLGSRNGTFVNGSRIEGNQQLSLGDHIQVGPLEFEVSVTRPKREEPKVSTTGNQDSNVDGMINDWLDEADSNAENRRVQETRQYRVDESERTALEETSATNVGTPTNAGVEEEKEKKSGKEKKKPEKLPFRVQKDEPKDSQEAATMMLKKLFNRGSGSGK